MNTQPMLGVFRLDSPTKEIFTGTDLASDLRPFSPFLFFVFFILLIISGFLLSRFLSPCHLRLNFTQSFKLHSFT